MSLFSRVAGRSARITQPLIRFTHHGHSLPKVAVVMSGSGVNDGTEITEAVSVLILLSSRADYQVFGLNEPQMHVVNHIDGSEMNETRNGLIEASRIARGNIKDLKELKSKDFDACIFPGGFGCAKNMSNFATKGVDMTVNKEVERVVKDFHSNLKPLGFTCISPVIPAKVIGNGVEVTMGDEDIDDESEWPFAEATHAVTKLGGHHCVRSYNEPCVDESNRVVSSAAYMFNGRPHQIFESVQATVDAVLKLINY